MFRIYCEFKPAFKRADGGTRSGKPRQRRRGAWVVTRTVRIVATNLSPVETSRNREVGIFAMSPRRIGTRCSPRKLLEEYQAQQRRVRAVNRHA